MLLTQSTRTVFPTALPPSRAKHRTLGKLIRSRRPPRQAGNTTSVSQAREPRFREAEHLPRRCPAREGGACSPHRAGLPRAGPATPTPQGYRVHRGQQSWIEMCAQEQRGAATEGWVWGAAGRPAGLGAARAPRYCFLLTLTGLGVCWSCVGTPGAPPHLPPGKAARTAVITQVVFTGRLPRGQHSARTVTVKSPFLPAQSHDVPT